MSKELASAMWRSQVTEEQIEKLISRVSQIPDDKWEKELVSESDGYVARNREIYSAPLGLLHKLNLRLYGVMGIGWSGRKTELEIFKGQASVGVLYEHCEKQVRIDEEEAKKHYPELYDFFYTIRAKYDKHQEILEIEQKKQKEQEREEREREKLEALKELKEML